jgi:hypothetical protein
MQARQEKRKSRRNEDMGASDEDGEESEEEDPMEYLDLVKSALFETRRILEDIDEHGQLYLQIWEIFNIFCGKLINIDDDDSFSQSSRSEKTALQKSQDQSKTLEVLAIPQFVKYFRVADADEAFFEETIETLAELTQVEEYVNNGLPFAALINELSQAGFLLGCELTDKEPHAVMNAQVMMQILEKIQVIDSSERRLNIYKDVNDLDEIPHDQGVRGDYNDVPFGQYVYYNTKAVRYVDNSQARKRASGKSRTI